MPQRRDLTIDEAVRDPMIRLVMKADGVDPRAFETMLRSLAHAQRKHGDVPSSRSPRELGRGWPLAKVAGALGEACPSW